MNRTSVKGIESAVMRKAATNITMSSTRKNGQSTV